MKIWLDKIIKNSPYLRIVTDYYSKDIKNASEYYQKVKCYTVSDDKLKTHINSKIKIEIKELQKYELKTMEILQFKEYIEDNLTLYHNGDIHLTEDDLTNYNRAYNHITNNERLIDRSLYDYIIIDMRKSTRRRRY
jgi:hypothetical protein